MTNVLLRDCKSAHRITVEVPDELLPDLILVDKDFYKNDQKPEEVTAAYNRIYAFLDSEKPQVSTEHTFDGYFDLNK
jgi:hypothetical protein